MTLIFAIFCFFGWARAAYADNEPIGTAIMVGVLMVLCAIGISVTIDMGLGILAVLVR